LTIANYVMDKINTVLLCLERRWRQKA